jgi:16S rRNA (guanine527-N7)-methyltransferase
VTSSAPLPPRRAREPLPESLEAVPPLADSARTILAQGIRDLGLGADLPAPARARLEGHARLLLAWTEHINLTGIRDPDLVAREHLLDSLAAVPLLREVGPGSILDLGSGGGFPGIPLGIALPGARVLLVESIAKKARFLGVVRDALGMADRVEVAHARAEALASRVRVDAVCVRAVAGLGRLAELSAPLLASGGRLVAWKRGDVAAEIADAAAALERSGFEQPGLLDVPVAGLEDHRLVVARLASRSRSGRW